MRSDPTTRITVTLTREQAEHVLSQVYSNLEYMLRHHDARTCEDLAAIAGMLGSYERRIDELSKPGGEVTYAERRCDLEELADDLMDVGADQVRDVTTGAESKEHGELAALRRHELRQAETGAAIYDQIVREVGPVEVTA